MNIEEKRIWDKYRNQGITKLAAMEKELAELTQDKLKDNGKMVKALAYERPVFFFEIFPDWVKNDVKCEFYHMS